MNAIPNFIAVRTMILALVVAVCAIGLTNTAAWSAGDKDRASLILSNLPDRESADYKMLRDLAGKGESQDLDMMKSEKWFVPLERLDALIKAAEEKGVRTTRLEEETWNQILAPMAESEEMSPKQKSMMEKAMKSKAAMGASMMKSPAPDALDYALTTDVDKEHPTPPTLVIPLNDKTVVTVRRTSVTKTPNGYEWHGVVEGTGEPVTLLCWPGGRLSGTITYRGRPYVVKYMGGQMHAIVEFAPEKLPPEHGPADKGMLQKMNMGEDPLVRTGCAYSLMTPDASPRPSMEMQSQELTETPEDATVTLIVAYTKNAASNYFDIKMDLIDVAIAEVNQSFRTSGIDNVRVNVVHAYETDYVEEGSHFDHVYRFRDKGDGYMDEVHALRDKHGADVGILIVEDSMGCGLSIRIAAEEKDAFAALHHECGATMYTLAHEIGHLIGARHDRALDDTGQPFPYGHGFVNGTDWRTMMSYKDSCDGCERRPVWSSPDVKVEGVAAGDGNTDNARVIKEQARRVAGFRSSTARADRKP